MARKQTQTIQIIAVQFALTIASKLENAVAMAQLVFDMKPEKTKPKQNKSYLHM